jgi:uncharacterized protein YjlB
MSTVGRRDLLSLGIPASLAFAPMAEAVAREPRTQLLKDTGQFPNSRLPALIYEAALPLGADLADRFDALFEKHGWTGSWRNGLYRVHHYHSTAHEVLGVYRGWVKVRLGGPDGPLIELRAGDVAIIAAGIAHKNEDQSADFAVLGAYPTGTGPDMQYGKDGERPRTDHNIAALPLPPQDPVRGALGPLRQLWR